MTWRCTTTSNALRFRIYPESQAVLTLVGKKPGANWVPEVQDLTFIQHPGADMRAYDRLIASKGEDAMSPVENKNCIACYTGITAQNYHDLVQGKFLLCKSCGRILYLPE